MENINKGDIEKQPVTTFELGGYYIDFIKIEYFKEYYYNNLSSFSNISLNSFLKALDIPPKFFKEQPIETQKELLENREVFIREHKKYIDKVIVVARVKVDNSILNCSRLPSSEAIYNYNFLKPIDNIKNKFEHRSFIKDNYITYVVSEKIEKNKANKVLVIDFPITLNKKPVVHKALYSLPDETFATPIEHIQYCTSEEISLEEYSSIENPIKDNLYSDFFTQDLKAPEEEQILREPEVVTLALVQAGVIPNSYVSKVTDYIKENTKGTLTTTKLESLVLDYDETFRGYKQVRAIREISGHAILKLLESPTFKEYIEEMEKVVEELNYNEL